MALNLKAATAVSAIPSRVRGEASDADKEAVYKEFFELISMAQDSDSGMVAVPVEGAAECNKYQNALGTFKAAHPRAWACLSTAGGKYEGGKQLSFTLYAAARPQERKLAKLKEIDTARNVGVSVRKSEAQPEIPADESDTDESAVG